MSTDVGGLLRALGRELVVAVLTWVGALTALFVVYGSIVTWLESLAQRQGIPPERMQELLPVGEGPVVGQWLEFVASYSTYDFGYSIANNEPVALLFGQGLARSVIVLFAFVAVTVVLGVVALLLTTWLRPGQRRILTVPAYVLGLLAPIVGGMLVLWYAYATGSMPVRLTPQNAMAGGVNGGLLLFVSFVVALPIVGDAVRRAHRESDGEDALSFESLFAPGRGGFGTVELWSYFLYLLSSLVVVENLFAYQGLGWFIYEGLQANDPVLVLGIAAGLTLLAVVLSLFRNVAWVIARFVRSSPGRTAPAQTESQVPDGGPGQGQASPGDVAHRGAQASDTSGLWNAVIGHRKVQTGTALLGLATVLGFLGALAAPVESMAFQRPPAPGLTGGILLNTMGSLATGVLVTFVLATVLGVLPGLVAGALEGYEIGPGTVLSTILRIPSEVAVVVPFAVAGMLYVVAYPPDGPGGGPTAVGTVTGLVLAGFAFRAVYEAASARIAATGPNADWIGASLVAGVARLDFVAVVTLFVAGELAFLGTLPFGSSGPYLAYIQLDLAFTQFAFLISSGGNVVGVLLAIVLATAPFAIGFYLIGDGLGEIAARLRGSGVGANTPRDPPTRQPGGTHQSPPGGQHAPGQSQPAGGQGQPTQRQEQPSPGTRQPPQGGESDRAQGNDGADRHPPQ